MSRRLFGQDRQAERSEQQRLQTQLSGRFRESFAASIRQTMREGADGYERNGEDALDASVRAHRAEVESTLRGDYESAWEVFSGRVLDGIEQRHGGRGRWQRKDRTEEAVEEAKRQFIAEALSDRVDKIMRTTRNQMRAIITRSIADGVGVDEIGRRIRNAAPEIARARSEVIARTETHSASMGAQNAAAEASDVTVLKGWISAGDDRTRDDEFDHVFADNEQIAVGELYQATGEPMRYPGDPNGSPGNIILCRCGEEYVTD